MSRSRLANPDQFDLFEPPHEWCEDSSGSYLQYLIAPPTELAARPGEEPPVGGRGTRWRVTSRRT